VIPTNASATIKDLRKVTRASIVMSWMGRQIQPLQKRSNFGFYYIGIKDLSCFTSKKINESEAGRWVRRVLDGVYGIPTVPDTFTMQDSPKEVLESNRFEQVNYLYVLYTKVCTFVAG